MENDITKPGFVKCLAFETLELISDKCAALWGRGEK